MFNLVEFKRQNKSLTLILNILTLLISIFINIKFINSQQNQMTLNQNLLLNQSHVVNLTSQNVSNKQPDYLETGRQITGILDKFMSLGYDKRVRPNYGGPPVEVNVTMRILSISSVSEVMMDFTADFYFRQTWHDPRLSFKKLGHIQTLYVGAEVSKKIWLPDTFFGNEKLAYFHEATTPNVFLRIDHSGEVYRSIRLTVTSSCPMNLQYFPMDRQRCTIEAESYGYNVKDIIYRWARKDTAVERDKEISLPQFDIVKTVQKYRLEELSSGTYSRLIAEIHFARRMGYYLIQIYIPSSLIVVISWVSFWLHRNASPARVQLGVTTVLTMTTLMSSTNAALPKISYVKSIDIFLGTCFIMVFAALLEYATVGYLGKRIAMRKAHMQHAQSQAQARIFAQLQAQGAQGDPIPPMATNSMGIFDDNNNNNNNSNQLEQQQQQSSPLLGQIAQQAALIQQQQQLAARGTAGAPAAAASQTTFDSNLMPPEIPERSHRCNHQSSSNTIFGQQHCNHNINNNKNHNHDHDQQQQQHYHNHHHHHHNNINELNSFNVTSTCQHHQLNGQAKVANINRVCCCKKGATTTTINNNNNNNNTIQNRRTQKQLLADNLNCSCCLNCHCQQQHNNQINKPIKIINQLNSNANTLPRNFMSINQQQQQQLLSCEINQNNNLGLISPSTLFLNGGDPTTTTTAMQEKSMHEATGGVNFNGLSSYFNNNISPSMMLQIGSNNPPSYCYQNNNNNNNNTNSKGASAAAAAAAATFVNLHRKQKGLPPSTNPNFAQFANLNRGLETIFGIRPSDIDKYSRVVFPVCFVCFQLMYWIVYLHISAFLETEQQQQQQH